MLIKIVYLANILVAGWISITSLFFPRVAQASIFENQVAYSEAIRLVGALWGGVFILSIWAFLSRKNEPDTAYAVDLQIVMVDFRCFAGHDQWAPFSKGNGGILCHLDSSIALCYSLE